MQKLINSIIEFTQLARYYLYGYDGDEDEELFFKTKIRSMFDDNNTLTIKNPISRQHRMDENGDIKSGGDDELNNVYTILNEESMISDSMEGLIQFETIKRMVVERAETTTPEYRKTIKYDTLCGMNYLPTKKELNLRSASIAYNLNQTVQTGEIIDNKNKKYYINYNTTCIIKLGEASDDSIIKINNCYYHNVNDEEHTSHCRRLTIFINGNQIKYNIPEYEYSSKNLNAVQMVLRLIKKTLKVMFGLIKHYSWKLASKIIHKIINR